MTFNWTLIFMMLNIRVVASNNDRTCRAGNNTLRKHPHMFYTPSFTLLYSRKGEMRGTQNEGLFSGHD